jgi:hypothetical protein
VSRRIVVDVDGNVALRRFRRALLGKDAEWPKCPEANLQRRAAGQLDARRRWERKLDSEYAGFTLHSLTGEAVDHRLLSVPVEGACFGLTPGEFRVS